MRYDRAKSCSARKVVTSLRPRIQRGSSISKVRLSSVKRPARADLSFHPFSWARSRRARSSGTAISGSGGSLISFAPAGLSRCVWWSASGANGSRAEAVLSSAVWPRTATDRAAIRNCFIGSSFSFVAQRDQRVHARGPPRRDETGDDRDEREEQHDDAERQRVGRA